MATLLLKRHTKSRWKPNRLADDVGKLFIRDAGQLSIAGLKRVHGEKACRNMYLAILCDLFGMVN